MPRPKLRKKINKPLLFSLVSGMIQKNNNNNNNKQRMFKNQQTSFLFRPVTH